MVTRENRLMDRFRPHHLPRGRRSGDTAECQQFGGTGDRPIEQETLLGFKIGGRAQAYAAALQLGTRRFRKERILSVVPGELVLDQAANKDNGQLPLPRFMGSEHV